MPVLVVVWLLAGAGGCAKYNTYYNAKRAFDSAERVRDEALRKHEDPRAPVGAQKTDYEAAIAKAQKLLDDYPGHSLSDDALFLRGKAYYRLESYRMSIRQFDLLFTNFPTTEYMEEALYLQALNYLLIGALDRSQYYLDQMARVFPQSRFQSEVNRVSGDNAYALKDWKGAAAAYRIYLGTGNKVQDRDRISLKLAECCWEQKAYANADSVLREMLSNVGAGEVGFDARILRGRVLARMGDFDEAANLLDGLDESAAFYHAEGELALAGAELMVARGAGDEAVTRLENLPTEWLTPAIKARASDMLGYQFMAQGRYEEAQKQFQSALGLRNELDNVEETSRLNEQLKDYLAATNALPDAKGERVPRLKLLQANAMLFGFDRPARAAALYREAAADTAADSTLGPRALYGMWVVYGQKLDSPDSAAIAAAELEKRFPLSAQAMEIRSGGTGDLLGYLLAQRDQVQARNLANLSAAERTALETVTASAPSAGAERSVNRRGLRRRMIYLARRDNIVFPPPEFVGEPLGRESGGDRRLVGDGSAAQRAASAMADSLIEGNAGAAFPGAEFGTDDAVTPATPNEAAAPPAPEETPPAEPKKKKKEPPKNWDQLREPLPGPRP